VHCKEDGKIKGTLRVIKREPWTNVWMVPWLLSFAVSDCTLSADALTSQLLGPATFPGS